MPLNLCASIDQQCSVIFPVVCRAMSTSQRSFQTLPRVGGASGSEHHGSCGHALFAHHASGKSEVQLCVDA